MRKYDRVKKEWVSEEELDRRTKARQKTCKGGREHDYVEVLPYGVSANDKYQGSVEPYYEAEKQLAEFAEKLERQLLEKGIEARLGRYRRSFEYRRLMCAVCKKEKSREVSPKPS